MPFDPGHAASVFMGYFAIMNPIANTPIFLGLTADEDDPGLRRAVALRAVLTAFAIVTAFAFFGQSLLELFGITLPAFRITGGVLVALIGYQMLHGEPSRVQAHATEAPSRETQLGVAISPLAMPILAGPGTIATTMNFTGQNVDGQGGLAQTLVTIVVFAVLCALTFVLFVSGERLVGFLGKSALGAITRLMGLILAVIGVQMLVDGIEGVFHGMR